MNDEEEVTGSFQIPPDFEAHLEKVRQTSEVVRKSLERIQDGIARRSGVLPMIEYPVPGR